VVGAATGLWRLDRGDRPRGRPRPLHRLLVGAQARPDVRPCGTPRGARPDRARSAGRDRLLRPIDPRHRRRLRAQPDDDPPLATPPRPRVRPEQATCRHRRGGPRGPARAGAGMCQSRYDAPRAQGGRLPLRPLRGRAGGGLATQAQADPGRGSRRIVHALRLRRVHGCAAVPSRRPRHEVVRLESRGRHAFARPNPRGSAQVRPAVCELPCQGRSWARSTSPKIGRSSRLSCVAQEGAVRGSSMAEHSTVNRRVVGSSPTPGARETPVAIGRLARLGTNLGTNRRSVRFAACPTTSRQTTPWRR
jgi:hypothetical protein